MPNDTNITRIRRELLVKLARGILAGTLADGVDRLPVDMRPRRGGQARLRCCVHSERAVLRGRILAMLGVPEETPEDELKPLSAFAREALERRRRSPRLLTVIEEACSACVPGTYFVSDACRGCMAQPCMLNCPRQAIRRERGRAVIDPGACVNCGRCRDLCAFGAIVKVTVPCEEACPAQAITRGPDGVQAIDPDRCTACGRCLVACPFGAVAEVSELADVLGALRRGEPLAALWAPALAGQFQAAPERVQGALLELGFQGALPVAAGADLAAAAEAREVSERLDAGEPFMTSSCCPAFTGLLARRFPALAPRVSRTPTPLQFAARLARERFPGARLVFISPCVAKRREVLDRGAVDHVLTIEELGAALVAAEIEVAACAPAAVPEGSPAAWGFAASGGVRDAVLDRLPEGRSLATELIDGLGPEGLRALKGYAAGRGRARFLEGMNCAGGCVGGPCTMTDARLARRRLAPAAAGAA